MTTGALSGLSVLELGSMVAAPYCAKLLADLGADVVKVEAPGLGDPARRRGPFPDDVPHLERSALFLYLNTSKRGVTLDLGSETGRRIFRDLAGDVDVLIESINLGQIYRYITKPWDAKEVRGVLRQAIERYHLQRENTRLVEQLQQYTCRDGRPDDFGDIGRHRVRDEEVSEVGAALHR